MCSLIRESLSVSEGIDDENVATNSTYSSKKIDELLNSADTQPDWDETDDSSNAYIQNKPEFEVLTVDDITAMVGLSDEELETLATVIVDTEARTDKTYSSSKIAEEIQKASEYSKPILLWENPDLSAEFVSQTITVGEEYGECKYFEIIGIRRSSSSTGRLVSFSTGRIPVGQAVYMTLFTQYYYARIVNVPSQVDGGYEIVIGDCTYSSTYGGSNDKTDNTFCTPMIFLGYRE